MELRTISLFLDYKEKKDSINQQGWSVSIWPKEKSCMYFDFKIPGEENRTIAIDVYFMMTMVTGIVKIAMHSTCLSVRLTMMP